jgi:hypothetical protein
MLARRVPWVSVAVLVAVTSATALAVAGNGYRWTDPQPPITSVKELATKTIVSDVGLTLDAPATQVAPGISAQEAVKTAWAEEGAPGDPQGVHVSLALLTWGTGYTKTPVWVVSYEGADCMIAAGAPGGAEECVKQAFHTLVNAESGDYVASFTSPESEGL